jgi:Protein of unknown function (DUF3530)
MKDAHCTESLPQRPQAVEPHSTSIVPSSGRRRSAQAFIYSLLISITLMSPLTTAQTTPTPSPESTEAPVEAAPEPAPYGSREERDMTLLAQGVEDETAVWLEALEQPFLALYEQELTGNAVGAVLIINAEGQHSSWPTTSERIRLSLPEFGWNTLSTELPLPESRPIPQRSPPIAPPPEEAPEEVKNDSGADTPAPAAEPVKAADGEDKEIYDSNTDQLSDGSLESTDTPTSEADELKIPVEDVAVARLHAAIDYLHQQGQFNIVLMGSGVGALRSVCFLKEIPALNATSQTRLIRSLVIINARNRLPNDDRQLHSCLDTPDMPVLDIYTGLEERNQVEAKERRKYAQRKRYETFQQLRLPELARNTMLGENRLSRRIRGFLEKHARGVKIDNAVIKKP